MQIGKNTSDDLCTLYVMKFVLDDGSTIYKVGITCIKPVDRMLQVLRSFFMAYRYMPRASLKRFRKVENHFDKETELHHEFADYRCTFESIFDGHTECFDIDEALLLARYDAMCGVYKKELQ